MWGEEKPRAVSSPNSGGNSDGGRRCGYVYEELMMWHDSGTLSFNKWTQPSESWENSLTKSRFHGLLEVSGLTPYLKRINARKATKDEILRFHTEEYVNGIMNLSETMNGGNAGDFVRFAHGGYEIALLSAGGVLTAVEEMMSAGEDSNRKIDNAYCLVRPPGHHAERDTGKGFCIFNNIALGALHARYLYQQQHPSPSPQERFRIAIIDYDVHHGNGTQQAFWSDPDTLFICLHQDSNYPIGTGKITETGDPERAPRSVINVPLPPGSGCGAYRYAFDKLVIPAVTQFQPQFIFVSSGFDASFTDQLGAMMLSSEAYRYMTQQLVEVADKCCPGHLLFAHEGGYSKDYVPYCGLAVVETLSGMKTACEDPYLGDVHNWGYQDLQPHQQIVIDTAWDLHNASSSLPQLQSPSLPTEEGGEGDVYLAERMRFLFKEMKSKEGKEKILELLREDLAK
jgi:acetoin utilization deacetylase AcuC-like enzyme